MIVGPTLKNMLVFLMSGIVGAFARKVLGEQIENSGRLQIDHGPTAAGALILCI